MPGTTDLPPRSEPDLGVILRDERAQALAQVADLAAELDGIMAAAEAAPPDDEHDAEGSTVGYERARVSALLDHARDRLAGLDDALGRLEAGEYGRCEGCGRPIPRARLEARPEVRTCTACASRL